MDSKFVHSKKACSLIAVTLPGILTDIKFVQSPKVNSPIVVTPLGISMDILFFHQKNAFLSISTILFGSFISSRYFRCSKNPIGNTLSSISTPVSPAVNQ